MYPQCMYKVLNWVVPSTFFNKRYICDYQVRGCYVNANIYVANAWRVGSNWLISTCSNLNYKPVSNNYSRSLNEYRAELKSENLNIEKDK